MPKKPASKINAKNKKQAPMLFQSPKGTRDVLPFEQPLWEKIRRVAEDLMAFYNFQKIETPVLEFANLFERGVGEETDVVRKEMYTLKTRGGDTLALRPEGTAPVVRAYVEHNLSRVAQPQRLFYEAPMFRYENPQHGRYREHHHIGAEVIGGLNDPIYDAQVVVLFDRLLAGLKIKKVGLKINSIGCRVCRPIYKRQLVEYYKRFEKELCEDCRRRLEINPLRLLDCKKESCQPFKAQAPNFLDKICAACSRHFQGVLEYLDELKISYSLDNQLVRGLDYYSRTVFEFFVEDSDVGAIGGGGRYDYLIEILGGRLTPAVGGAMGVERIVEVMKSQELAGVTRSSRRVFLAHVGSLAKKKAIKIIEDLREAGIPVSEALGKESLKAQLKIADREKFPLALILGQKEIYEESIIVRDLRTGLQESVSLAKMAGEIKKRW